MSSSYDIDTTIKRNRI